VVLILSQTLPNVGTSLEIVFMGTTIPPEMLKRSPRFGGNEPFLGPLFNQLKDF
jgi:hypothetical protein